MPSHEQVDSNVVPVKSIDTMPILKLKNESPAGQQKYNKPMKPLPLLHKQPRPACFRCAPRSFGYDRKKLPAKRSSSEVTRFGAIASAPLVPS
ncbi:hypothetical protein GGI35DRAFT_236258 [Trichoderma velutinum]